MSVALLADVVIVMAEMFEASFAWVTAVLAIFGVVTALFAIFAVVTEDAPKKTTGEESVHASPS
jgi:heme/copper-type cytochrome/quinol oxidase subunit 2